MGGKVALPVQWVTPGDGAEEQQDEGERRDSSAHPQTGAVPCVSPGTLA